MCKDVAVSSTEAVNNPAYLLFFNSWIQRRLISCSKKRHLLLFQFAHHLELWRLGSTVATGTVEEILSH